MRLAERDAHKVLRPTTAVPKVKRKKVRPKSAKRSSNFSPKPLKKQPIKPDSSFVDARSPLDKYRPWERRHNKKRGRPYSTKKKKNSMSKYPTKADVNA